MPKHDPMDFWRNIAKAGPDDCWEWTAGKGSDRYGFRYGHTWFRGKCERAHRVAWELTHGLRPVVCADQRDLLLGKCGLAVPLAERRPLAPFLVPFLGTNGDNVADRRAVAAAFGISQSTVWRIKTRATWGHVP